MADGKGLAYMEPADLYALFGNALENAIEATEQLTDPAQKQIVLTVRPVEGFCSVHLQNYTKTACPSLASRTASTTVLAPAVYSCWWKNTAASLPSSRRLMSSTSTCCCPAARRVNDNL